MKALVLPQPYAAAILAGFTPFYSVRRPIKYRGPVAILSARHKHLLRDHYRLIRAGFRPLKAYQLGAILGTAELIDCRRAVMLANPDSFADGPYCLEFTHPRPLDQPVAFRGPSAIFELPNIYIEPGEPAPLDGKAAAYTPSALA